MSGNTRRIAAQRRMRVGGQALDLDSPVLADLEAQAHRVYLERRAELAPLPPVAERSRMLEGHWQKQVITVATQLGYWHHHPKVSRYSTRGVPDLMLLHEGRGRALWAELKDDEKHLSEWQVEVIDRMRACGLEVHIWRPWHTLERVVEVLQHG